MELHSPNDTCSYKKKDGVYLYLLCQRYIFYFLIGRLARSLTLTLPHLISPSLHLPHTHRHLSLPPSYCHSLLLSFPFTLTLSLPLSLSYSVCTALTHQSLDHALVHSITSTHTIHIYFKSLCTKSTIQKTLKSKVI
jgi:hypothetical protein